MVGKYANSEASADAFGCMLCDERDGDRDRGQGAHYYTCIGLGTVEAAAGVNSTPKPQSMTMGR